MTLAYVLQPLLRFADPDLLAFYGFFLAIALGVNLFFKEASLDRTRVIILVATAIGSALVPLGCAFWQASQTSQWNDARCLRIQAAMLRPTASTRTDLAAVFEALQCRPQGELPNPPANSQRPAVNRTGPPPDPNDPREKAWEAWLAAQIEHEVIVDRPPAPSTPAADPVKLRANGGREPCASQSR